MSEHRMGINPGFLANHTLSLSGVDAHNSEALLNELDALPCMDKVEFNAQKHILTLAYDASHHNIDELLKIIEKHGVAVSNSWWSRYKLGWQRQTDENIRDNAAHQPHCCNKSPRL